MIIWYLKYAGMEESSVQNKVKYIPWILGAILLVITVVSVNELFKSQEANKILQTANKQLTEEQNALNDTLDIKDAIIKDLRKERKEVAKRREERKEDLNEIDEEYEEIVRHITSDDTHADVRAVGNILRQHTNKRSTDP